MYYMSSVLCLYITYFYFVFIARCVMLYCSVLGYRYMPTYMSLYSLCGVLSVCYITCHLCIASTSCISTVRSPCVVTWHCAPLQHLRVVYLCQYIICIIPHCLCLAWHIICPFTPRPVMSLHCIASALYGILSLHYNKLSVYHVILPVYDAVCHLNIISTLYLYLVISALNYIIL